MTRRIWMLTLKQYDYMPLRAGLGQITEEELAEYVAPGQSRGVALCPKRFTTRTQSLSGEYVVVEGSRFKAKPVEPEIRFRVDKVAELDLNGVVTFRPDQEFDFSWKTYPAQDLGEKWATFAHLRDELLRLNKKATIDTPFFVNKIEPVEDL